MLVQSIWPKRVQYPNSYLLMQSSRSCLFFLMKSRDSLILSSSLLIIAYVTFGNTWGSPSPAASSTGTRFCYSS